MKIIQNSNIALMIMINVMKNLQLTDATKLEKTINV